MNLKLTLTLSVLLVISASGSEKGGLILHGIDTISVPKQKGFDFANQVSCTTSIDMPPYPCIDHFFFGPNGIYSKYILQMDVQDGDAYFIKVNKINLDSIKTAPADSVFSKQPLGQGDSIPVDSLSSRIGNVYLMKTVTDPRDKYPYYAKLKIIKFIVIDSAAHQIKMVFLWAANLSGQPDLSTSGLDTFHLETPTINQPNGRFANGMNRTSPSQHVFKVMGDKFALPQELIGKVKWLTVWDLRGRRVGRIEMGKNNSFLELPKDLKGKGMFLVKGK